MKILHLLVSEFYVYQTARCSYKTFRQTFLSSEYFTQSLVCESNLRL